MHNNYLKLMLITNRQTNDLSHYLDFIEHCVLGGITSVQLREKKLPAPDLIIMAEKLKLLLDRYNVPLIINDNVDLTVNVDASGVHLGQTDGSPIAARERLGTEKIIGLSLESEEDLLRANALPVDYAAASAVFSTANKHNIRKLWGTSGLATLASTCVHPVIAIGGIDLTNASAVITAGAAGIAVIGVLHQAENPEATAFDLLRLVNGGKQ